MATTVVEDERIRRLNRADADRAGRYVLYWMQQSQRARFNPALEYAVRRANELGRPLLVGFGLMDGYPEANARHYRFMLEGLADTRAALAARGIPFRLERGAPPEVALRLGADAALVVCDRGYLRHQRAWRREVADGAAVEVVQVEGDAAVPVELVSGKAEYAARTIRPKLHRHLDNFLVELRTTPLAAPSMALAGGESLADLEGLLDRLDIDRSVPPVHHRFTGGESEARRRLRAFLREELAGYDDARSDPAEHQVSHLAMHLHFGHISPVQILLELRDSGGPREDRASFLEELVVRRELAFNYTEHTADYDSFGALPEWARKTLARHADDEREHRYTARELEEARTHDPYWNAAMREMRYTGYLHNRMRMYWGKRILAWTHTPEHAFRVTLELNNRYLLDGRDPASYANVAWVFGLHDRPWGEREVFGTVRTMTAGGLRRKGDMEAWLAQVNARVAQAQENGVRFESDDDRAAPHAPAAQCAG